MRSASKAKYSQPIWRPHIVRIFISFLLVVCVAVASAQRYTFRNYSLEEGVSQAQVLTMTQDSMGYLWLGTSGGGISRFNGTDFSYFNTQNGLVSNTITALLKDNHGRIWIGTDEGAAYFDGNHFVNFRNRSRVSLQKVLCLLEDDLGRIWLGTEGGGVEVFDGKNFEYIDAEKNLLNNYVNTLYQDKAGQVWISCYGEGITIKDGHDFMYLTQEAGLLSNYVTSITEDDQGAVWIASEAGITIIKDGEFSYITEKDGLPVSSVSCFYLDQSGYMWVGTSGGGIAKYDGYTIKVINERNGLSSNYVNQIFEDENGGIWIATNGGGVSRFGGMTFTSFSRTEGLSNNMVTAIHDDIHGNFWFGTDGSGLDIYDGQKVKNIQEILPFESKYVTALEEDHAGNLWVGTYTDGLFRYNDEQFEHFVLGEGLVTPSIHCLYQDPTGRLWIGGEGGLCYFQDGQFIEMGQEDGMNVVKVNDIEADRHGNVWFATNQGVVRFDGHHFEKFSMVDGLLTNQIRCLATDMNGDIWVGMNGGIAFYEGAQFITFGLEEGLLSTGIYSMVFGNDQNLYAGTGEGVLKVKFNWEYKIERCRLFKSEDGFRGVFCNPNSIYKDNQGNIWLGSIRGVTRYNPQFDLPNSRPPDVYVDDILLFFETPSWQERGDSTLAWSGLPEKLDLNYDENHVTFQFVGVQFDRPEKIRYRFKLEGFDEHWSPATSKREAIYSNLPPGQYQFKVKAANADGVWQEQEASFEVVIAAPFWETWWFYFIVGTTAVTSIYLFILMRTRRLRQSKKMLEEKVRLRTLEIMKQKNELENLSIVASETVQGVIIADNNGRIEWANDGLMRMCGYDFQEFKANFGENIQSVSDLDHADQIIAKLKETKMPYQYDSTLITSSGELIWLNGTITPTFRADGELKKLVIILTDITERKATEEEIKQKNKDITDSILYAKQIQEAILPNRSSLKDYLPESFIFYQPRDIVSGDFYWYSDAGQKLFVAAADCTGHGVPGALMSMIGNTFLHQVVNQPIIPRTNHALEKLDFKIKRALHQVGEEMESRDGMDIALLAIDLDDNILEFSGAHRPAFIVRNGEIRELKPDSIPIGGFYNKAKKFSIESVDLESGDAIYIFSDGYVDQFGGEKGKKFLMKRFKQMLLDIQHMDMEAQQSELGRILVEWKGDEDQVDDILVIGLKIP